MMHEHKNRKGTFTGEMLPFTNESFLTLYFENDSIKFGIMANQTIF
jgi:hypothetical protein